VHTKVRFEIVILLYFSSSSKEREEKNNEVAAWTGVTLQSVSRIQPSHVGILSKLNKNVICLGPVDKEGGFLINKPHQTTSLIKPNKTMMMRHHFIIKHTYS